MVLAFGAALAAAAPAHAARGMEIALQDDAVLVSQRYFDRGMAFALMRDLNVSRIRMNAVWYALNGRQGNQRKAPRRPRYNFAALDSAIDAALLAGFNVQLSITGQVPRWAAKNRKNGSSYKPNARLFGKFAAVVAKRYKGKVDVYSIWNEPNHVSWLSPLKQQGRLYRQLYEAGYRAVKRVDPAARVLIAETAPYPSKKRVALPPLRFLRDLTCVNKKYRPVRKCKPLVADGFAHHPYDFKRPPTRRYPGADNVTIANLGSLTRALDRLAKVRRLNAPNGQALDLYLTEYGYFARKETGREKVFPEKRRAAYLKKAFRMAQANPRVRSMLQYLLVEYPKGMFRFNTSIVQLNGRLTRPYRVLRSWARSAARKGLIATPRPPYQPPPPPPPQQPPPPPPPPPPCEGVEVGGTCIAPPTAGL